MKCHEFEELISSFVDGELAGQEAAAFREHQIGCVDCRSLLDTIQSVMADCQELPDCDPSLEVVSRAIVIPALHPPIDCDRFAALVTEFLDGFLEAAVYHAFEDHARECAGCSDIVSGVALAVTACHSVHFSEELDVSASLLERIFAETTGTHPAANTRRAKAFAAIRRALSLYSGPVWAPRVATAAVIVAVFSMLVTNGGLAPSAMYERAARVTTRVADRSAQLEAKTGEVMQEVERIRSDVDEILQPVSDQNSTEQPSAPPANGTQQSSLHKTGLYA